jgi:kynureninase
MDVPLDRRFAERLDREDPLAGLRAEFHVPKREDGADEIYLTGHSLGLQPVRTERYVAAELESWRDRAVRGHFETNHPWMSYHRLLAGPMSGLVGALESEVVLMNTLTVNLHLLMVGFYRPTPERHRILIEDHAFPSDRYAVESQIRFHGYDPASALLLARPRLGEELLRDDDLLELIDRHGESIALVLLPGVQYYTGQLFDIGEITRRARAKGCAVGFDLAHAAGNVELSLHDWNVDFAAWCTYKYLNSGPGSVGAAFVHERHAHEDLPRFAGWWGHDESTRFRMGPVFRAIPGADGWQLSNPPILALAAIRASLDVFALSGGMGPLRAKSLKLTAWMESLLRFRLGDAAEIITPSDPECRGCQLSIHIRRGEHEPREVFARLEAAGVTCDWREPNVIRAAPVPLYNSFTEVWDCVDRLAGIMRPAGSTR